jgi:hypothetical protein
VSGEGGEGDGDCRAVGFSGEGRCVQPAGSSGFCADHDRCTHCDQTMHAHTARGYCTRKYYVGGRFTFPAVWDAE